MRALAQETMVLQQTPSLDSIEEKPRKVPVVKACDVCVLGGGCTGVFAAVRAAQMGARVALVEKQNAFGGMATAGIVNVWHKLISNSQDRKQIIGGLTEQVIKKLELLGAVNSDAHGFYLNTEELKIELDALVLEHKITPYLNTVYVGAHLQHNQINAVSSRIKMDARQSGQVLSMLPAMAIWRCTPGYRLKYAMAHSRRPPVRKSSGCLKYP